MSWGGYLRTSDDLLHAWLMRDTLKQVDIERVIFLSFGAFFIFGGRE